MIMDTTSDNNCGQSKERGSANMLLVTANVGSLFEDPARLLEPWLKEFIQKVSEMQPDFLALHLQEVGGKTYEKSMEYVQEFIRSLCDASEMRDYAFINIFMDEDFNSAEHFTALGNLYFARSHLRGIQIWNFLTHEWESAEDRNIYSGNIETIPTKEKAKFPQHFFPECKWSRKGFMRTRWQVQGTVFDLVNIHLFHDASNLAACEEFPSVYCKTRRRALVHTLERFHLDDKNGIAPFFVFGDFNFRCDTEGVIKELTSNLTAHRVQNSKSESTKVHYRNFDGHNVLTVGKKEFIHADHQLKFKEAWLKKFDKELEPLSEILLEYPINFPPTYPYEEDPEMPTDYMSTRCPSWCDRILLSAQAKEIISDDQNSDPYNIVGENICMGDHKPIYLNIRLKSNQGTYRCCMCYLYNKSTSKTPAAVLANDICAECPYNSKFYIEILCECKALHKECILVKRERQYPHTAPLLGANCYDEAPNPNESSQKLQHTNSNDSEVLKNPPVSINLIDSDNIYVCMCVQIAHADNDDIDGSICRHCRNIIKKQSVEHRYRLVSKRLLLSENVIVNRIDAQYLNTYSDAARQRDDLLVYTPESLESHSPCPELNSNNSTTSSNGHSPPLQKLKQPVNMANTTVDTNERIATQTYHLKNTTDDTFGKQQRGVVTPGQLKSRLEDLQRSSKQNLHQSIATAECDDVEIVEDVCSSNSNTKRRNIRTLQNCCNIN